MEYYCDVIIRENAKVTRCYRGEHAKLVTVDENGEYEKHKRIYEYFEWLFGGKPFKVLRIRVGGR